MNQDTYKTLKRLVERTRYLLTDKYANRKRLTQDEVWQKATTLRDITDIEGWIDEVAKEYQD